LTLAGCVGRLDLGCRSCPTSAGSPSGCTTRASSGRHSS